MAVFPGPFPVADPGEGPGGAAPPPPSPSLRKHPFLLALRRCGRFAAKSDEKWMFSQARPPLISRPLPPLSQGLDDRPPPHLSGGLDPPLFSILEHPESNVIDRYCQYLLDH